MAARLFVLIPQVCVCVIGSDVFVFHLKKKGDNDTNKKRGKKRNRTLFDDFQSIVLVLTICLTFNLPHL